MRPHLTIGILLLAAILVLLPTLSAAQRCEFYSGSVCAPVYSSESTLIYIANDDFTQQQIETQMRRRFALFSAVERESCGPYLLALLCSQYLPTCSWDNNNDPQPRYPCDSFCPSHGLPDVVADPSKNILSQYSAPDQCSTFQYFFRHNNDILPYDVEQYENGAISELEIVHYFRPVCWPTRPRIDANSVSMITSLSPQPINQLTPSPLYISRYNSGAASTFINTGKGGGTLSAEEEVLIANNDALCDPVYHTFATQANVVASATRQGISGNSAGYYVDLPTQQCPDLLAPEPFSSYETNASPCVIPCPNLTFTHKQYQKQDVLVIVFNSLSIVSLFILCVSWSFFPALRLQNYVFYYIICITCMTLSLFVLIPIARAQHITIAESLCETPTLEYHMKGYPLFQGMVTAFAYMSATAWGLIMVLDIFIQVVIGKHFQKASREYILKERIYHVFAWFWGFYSLIGGLASQQFGATVSVGGSYALIIPSRSQQAEGVFNGGDAFFYYPLLVLTLISVVLMIAVLIRLLWFKSRAKTTGLRVATFVRLFIFIIANTFIICVFLVYAIFVNAERDNLEYVTTLFIECLHYSRTFLPGQDETLLCGDAPDHNLNFNILLLTVVLFNGMGLIAFLIYGTTTDLIYSWLGWMHVVFGIDKFKKFEKDYRRNRKSTRVGTTKTSQHPDGRSRNSKSGHQSNFLTSQHHHDSQTDRSYLHDPTQPRRDHTNETTNTHLRSQSKDPSARSQTRPSGSVFAYGNQKTAAQQKQRRPAGGVGLNTSTTRSPDVASTTEVEMADIAE